MVNVEGVAEGFCRSCAAKSQPQTSSPSALSRGQYTNVYLDSAEPIEPIHAGETEADSTDPEEAAWQTAVAAVPWR